MDNDLAKLLKYELGDSPSFEKKRNVSLNDFTSPATFRARIERYITQFSPGYWRSLTRGGMRTKIGSPKFSGNYNSGLNAAHFVRFLRQGVPGYVPLPLP